MAVRLDPTYSRAYAGLSFTHWQDAFQRWGEQQPAMDLAFKTAGQGLIADDRDPAAHWAMGRALWLRGSQDPSLAELQRAVDLSPNFALGHYSLGFVHCQSGDALAAIGSADHSRHLSPFDPLMFGMLAVRALALARLGRIEEAADWALKAAMRPNAHVHILAIAAHCLAIADRVDEALGFLPLIRKSHPAYRVDDLLAAFRLTPEVYIVRAKSCDIPISTKSITVTTATMGITPTIPITPAMPLQAATGSRVRPTAGATPTVSAATGAGSRGDAACRRTTCS
ncbi:hypothetical protein G6F35_012096 [Rhizopus arrhizus]|nr:hypothetical protein G6F35_012096 [Rhizopus arrhizus]